MRLEGIYQGLKQVGYEVLFESSELPLNGNKEKFFEKVDEEIDFLIFTEHVRRTQDIGGLKFLNIKPSTLIKYANQIIEIIDGKTVIELREDYAEEEEINAIRKLREKYPFLLSIDDFGRKASNFDRLFILRPNFVKIEIPLFDRKTLCQLVYILKTFPVKLIAEKVETEKDFKLVKSLNFDFWQGFFSKKVTKNKKLNMSQKRI